MALDDHPEQEEEAACKNAADEKDEVRLRHGKGRMPEHLCLLLAPRRQRINRESTFGFSTGW